MPDLIKRPALPANRRFFWSLLTARRPLNQKFPYPLGKAYPEIVRLNES